MVNKLFTNTPNNSKGKLNSANFTGTTDIHMEKSNFGPPYFCTSYQKKKFKRNHRSIYLYKSQIYKAFRRKYKVILLQPAGKDLLDRTQKAITMTKKW